MLRFVTYDTEKKRKGIWEMKRLLHKLRVWLIKKLGGNYGPDKIRTVAIQTTLSEPITLCAESTVSDAFLRRVRKEDAERLIKNECANQIVEMILHNDNFYEMVRFDNHLDLKCTFQMKVLILEQPKDSGLKGVGEKCRLMF